MATLCRFFFHSMKELISFDRWTIGFQYIRLIIDHRISSNWCHSYSDDCGACVLAYEEVER